MWPVHDGVFCDRWGGFQWISFNVQLTAYLLNKRKCNALCNAVITLDKWMCLSQCRFWNRSSSTVQMFSRCQYEDSPPLTCSPGAGSLPQRRMTHQTGSGWSTEVPSFPSTVPYSGMLEKGLTTLEQIICWCFSFPHTHSLWRTSRFKDSSLNNENSVVFLLTLMLLLWYSFLCEGISSVIQWKWMGTKGVKRQKITKRKQRRNIIKVARVTCIPSLDEI